jgi:homoserine O-acetyltransferase/O-succinyltransferase
MKRSRYLAAAVMCWLFGLAGQSAPSAAQEKSATWPGVSESDVVLHDFHFASGEQLPSLKIHYRILGVPHRDHSGEIDNAVLLLHSTSSKGSQFLTASFAGELFGAGQPLDAARYFIVIPDAIGHGGSSKPSDGLRGGFPHYNYDDMVEAQRQMLAQGLKIHRLRLVLGTSMGCMLTFVWAEAHAQYVQAAMPIACMPTQISGQNAVWRTAAVEAIKADPAWANGNYTSPPVQGLRGATGLLAVSGGIGPLAMERDYPSYEAAVAYWHKRLAAGLNDTDANDLLYQLEASRGYDAEAGLTALPMPLAWVNIGDDFINLPGSQVVADAAARIPKGRFYLVPASPQTRGHSTHSLARFWKNELVGLLERSERPK